MLLEGVLEGRDEGSVDVADENAERTVGIVVDEATKRSLTSSRARESGGSEYGVSSVPLEEVRSTIRTRFGRFGRFGLELVQLQLDSVKSMTSRASRFM